MILSTMSALIATNPYLRNARRRRRWLAENARESSAFEGAKGLPKPQKASSRRSMASRKKAAKSS